MLYAVKYIVKKGLKKYVVVLLCVLCCGLSAAAENVKISGTIRDTEDKPIEFATVRIGGTAIGTTTDLKGKYELSLAPKDTIEVIVSCVGFKEVSHKLIKPKGEITFNIKMLPADYKIDELEVVEFKRRADSMQTFEGDSFKLSPDVSGGSVEAMITTMAGVNSSNEMSSQYSVRGGSYDENSVYINGMEIYRPQLVRSGQQEGLSIINPDLVGNIKFSTGGFPAQYADKMSSVLDITYREPEAFEMGLSGSLMGGALYLGSNSRKFSQLHGLRFKKNNSLLSSMETKGEYDPWYLDYQTNLTFKPSGKITINFLGNISLNNYNFKPQDRETNFGTSTDTKQFKVYFDGEERDRFETYLGALSLTWAKDKSMDFTLGISGFLTNELVSYDISGEYWLDQAGTSGDDSVGGELGVGKYMEHSRNRLRASVMQVYLKGSKAFRANNRLNYGISWQNEHFHDRTKEWEWRDSAGYSLPHLPDGQVHLIYNLSSRHDLSTNRAAFYIEDTWMHETSSVFLTLDGGIRLSYWDFNKEFLVSPRANFTLSPLKYSAWTYRLALGMYYQSPFYKEFRLAQADAFGNSTIILNNDIKSPRSIQLIFGADYTFRAMNRPFKISAEAYYKNLSNLISYEYDNLKVTYSGLNDSKGYTMGIDFKLFGQFVQGSDSWISFSLMKTQQTLNGVKVPLPSDQRYSFALYFTDYVPKFPRIRFSLRGIFSDGLTMTAPRINRSDSWFRAPAYKRVDIGLSYQIIGGPAQQHKPSGFWGNFKNLMVGIDLFNIFDISNVSSYYWVTDVNNIQYAVPNYLTRRQINLRLTMDF